MNSFTIKNELVVVDDDYLFLEALELVLYDIKLKKTFFTEPRKALNYINDKSLGEHFKNDDKNETDTFEFISVILVDYKMPGIDGVSLCNQINCHYISKFLLTGYIENEVLVNAVQTGLISRIIRKEDRYLTNTLNKTIKEGVERFNSLVQDAFNMPMDFGM